LSEDKLSESSGIENNLADYVDEVEDYIKNEIIRIRKANSMESEI
jgi:hypothetical protein